MQGLEDRDLVALPGQVARAGEAGGTRADHSHLVAVGLGLGGRFGDMLVVPVGGKALEPTDTHRLKPHPQGAFALALGLLRADAAADGGQTGGLGDNLVGTLKVAGLHFGDEVGNGDIDRAALHAGTVFAVKAALRLLDGNFRGVAQGHLVEIMGPDQRLLGGHFMLLGIDGHDQLPPFSRLQVSS